MPPKRKVSAAPVTEPAPWYKVPSQHFISIEHPCIVKNIEKGIDMLGGSRGVRHALDPAQPERPVSLSLHPEDPTSRPVISMNRPTNNVLLQITVPKRTGRKRKRGTDGPFEEEPPDPKSRKDARYMLQSLSDNPENSEISTIGTIDRTHLFRSMPDFTYSVSSSPLVSEVTSKILPLQYPLVKSFNLDLTTRHNTSYAVLPPPIFSTHALPQNYSYRQNPAVKRTLDPSTNKTFTTNTSRAAKVFTYQLQFDTTFVPDSPDPSTPPLETQNPILVGLVSLLRECFTRRPIWTRRALMNQIPSSAPQFLLRHAIAYVAYAMRSGPWRDTYIRFSIDPRSSPDYRIYQTLMLQLVTSKREKRAQRDQYLRSWKANTDKTSHIFTNTPPFPTDGKAWQLCDLSTDAVLNSLVQTPHIRDTCEPRYYGWYHNGTSAKLRIVLKHKADTLMDGRAPDDAVYAHLVKLPEEYTYNPASEDNNWGRRPAETAGAEAVAAVASGDEAKRYEFGFLPLDVSKQETEFAAAYRGMCRTGGELYGFSIKGGGSKRATASKSTSVDQGGGDSVEVEMEELEEGDEGEGAEELDMDIEDEDDGVDDREGQGLGNEDGGDVGAEADEDQEMYEE